MADHPPVDTRALIQYVAPVMVGLVLAAVAFVVISDRSDRSQPASTDAPAPAADSTLAPADAPAPAADPAVDASTPAASAEDETVDDALDGVGGGLDPVDDSARRDAALERALGGGGDDVGAGDGTGGSTGSQLERQRYLERQAAKKGLAPGETMRSPRAARYRGNGAFTTVSKDLPVRGFGGRTVKYAVQVEGGLREQVAGFEQYVDEVLGDSRSWIGSGKVRVQQVSSASAAQFVVKLASPDMTDSLCAPMTTERIYSCRNGSNVVINYYRWIAGAGAYPASLPAYRTYLVNHEFGHALGQGHRSCPGGGSTAPVMLQQSIGLQGCVASEWPTASERSSIR